MINYELHFTDLKPTETDVFADATEAELRVLIALKDIGGVTTDEELAAVAGVSKARAVSAIALWQESGVIAEGASFDSESGSYGNTVKDEFEYDPLSDIIREESGAEIAKAIRSKALSSLIDECAAMENKPMLTPLETRQLTALISQYALSEEYVAMLAAHIKEKGDFTVSKLIAKAKNLVAKDIMTPDDLAVYISEKEKTKHDLMEYRRIFGIFNRAFSGKELEYLKKWTEEYVYGTEIVSLAYGLNTLNTGKCSFAYMDKLLSDWNANGCKTLRDCEQRYDEVRRLRDTKDEPKSAAPERRKRSEKQKPRYGDFDPEEAMKLALARSFFDEETEKK